MLETILSKYAKYSGVIAVMLEWLALCLFYILEPSDFDGHHPISFFATLPQTHYIFAACYTIAALNFWIFFWFNISKRYKTPKNVLALSLVTFAAVAVFPYNPSNAASTIVHVTMFLISSMTFMYSMYVISKSESNARFRNVSIALVTLSAVTFLIYVALSNSSLTMPLEAGWWLILQVWVIWISYCSFQKN
jgi:hypothetical protein